MPFDVSTPSRESARQSLSSMEGVGASELQRLTGCDLAMAERALAVIESKPNHWRDWRPSSPWDRTDLVLLRLAKALNGRAAL